MVIRMASMYDATPTVCAKGYITYNRVTVPAHMFWPPVYLILVYFTDILFHKFRY